MNAFFDYGCDTFSSEEKIAEVVEMLSKRLEVVTREIGGQNFEWMSA